MVPTVRHVNVLGDFVQCEAERHSADVDDGLPTGTPRFTVVVVELLPFEDM
jgi:hypothetical protein